jgi:hypothetical protein
METININILWNEFETMLYMLNHVLLHQQGRMLNIQGLNLVHGV